MQVQRAWLKPGVWGAVIGSILTMIVGFSWGGWTTSSSANQLAMSRADAAVTTALVPVCGRLSLGRQTPIEMWQRPAHPHSSRRLLPSSPA